MNTSRHNTYKHNFPFLLCSASSQGVMESCRKGTNGVSTNGVTANFMFFLTGTFRVLPLPYFYIPKSVPGRTFFPNPSKFITFAAAPLVLTPLVRNRQPLLQQPVVLSRRLARLLCTGFTISSATYV